MSKTIFEHSSAGRRAATLPPREIDTPLEQLIPKKYHRKDIARLPEVSEMDVMRHYIELSHKNHFIEKGLYPLGSCTMKYNPKIHETLVRHTCFANLHPYQPESTIQGALELMYELQSDLAEISGMKQVTLQPVAGAQGEFTGIKIVAAYHKAKGNTHKTKIIIPDSAHGTNPATCNLVGFDVVELKSDANGRCDLARLREIVDENTAGFMLTNPNTLGLFESQIEEIAEILHSVDALIYMDGANLNALMGIARPGDMGVDCLHVNLHKTFGTPHGGGGPGSGPVMVNKELERFLPCPVITRGGREEYTLTWDRAHSIGMVHSCLGNMGVLIKALTYILSLGGEGLRNAATSACLNANYLKSRLSGYFDLPFTTSTLHEFVLSDLRQKEAGITTMDIAKTLMEFGFHPPTVYFPLVVSGALMIEPTETESLDELERFAHAMETIAQMCLNRPEHLHESPMTCPVNRVDEVWAARNLILTWNFFESTQGDMVSK